MEDRRLLTVPALVVTTTADSGAGSLRAAIAQANSQGSGVIDFQIGAGGLQTISLLSALPAITVPVTIDGTSQPNSNGSAAIALDGTNAGSGANGLIVGGGASTIKGLIIDHFNGSGILIDGAGGDTVESCYLGVDPTGLAAAGNAQQGIIVRGAGNNTIGGLAPGSGNLISGNLAHGVVITDGSTGDVIEGNYIGVDQPGAHALGNAFDGIAVLNGQATIGGTAGGARNIISANGAGGIALNSASGTVVAGNYIGTDQTGEIALGNVGNGVTEVNSGSVTIGGSISGARNVVSANAAAGLLATGSDNVIQGNFIGVDASGSRALGNAGDGIFLTYTNNNTIGGAVAGTGNVISANGGDGIDLYSVGPFPSNNLPRIGFQFNIGDVLQGNFLGTDSTGANALGNRLSGIALGYGSSNLIGGPGGGNLISANGGDGIFIGGDGNVVQANTIGTNFFGDRGLPNGGNGANIVGNNNLIGGFASGTGNLISGNDLNGVELLGESLAPSVGNQVFGNIIGTDRTTAFAVPNGQNGVLVGPFSSTVVIGQAADGAGNLIAGNLVSGVVVNQANTVYVIGNSIGTSIGFAQPGSGLSIPNHYDGVTVLDSSHVQVGGLYNGMPNTIADNSANGITVASSPDVAMLSNFIENNAKLGIDIGNDGVTPNTLENPANYPVILSAENPVLGGNTVVAGSINSAPNTSVLIQFFSNPTADPSGHGQGRTPVGSTTVQTDSNGNATFSVALPQLLPIGQSLSATATSGIGASGAFGTTSEFSNDVSVTPGPQPADLALSLTQSTNFPAVNGALVYTLVVSNNGPGVATNVVLADSYPVTSIAVGATVSQGTAGLAGHTLTFHLGAIASGASATATVIVVPQQSGIGIDSASVVSDIPDPNLNNNSAAIDSSAAPSPIVQSVVLQAFRGDLTSVVVTFGSPMDSTRASNPANYAFYLPDARGAFTIPVIPSVASYQPSTNSVILTPGRLIPIGGFFQLSMNGITSAGLADPGGRLLDGADNGAPGSNYEAIVGIGRRLAYNDSHNNSVRLQLSGTGYLDVTRSLDGDASLLQVVGANSGVVTGQVIRGLVGNGATPLPQVIVPAGVAVQLTNPPFLLGGVTTQGFANVSATAFDTLSAQGGLPSTSRNHKRVS